MANADELHLLSKPVATMVTSAAGSAAGIIVAAHVGHPTAASVTSAGFAGMLALIGGVDTVARFIDPWVRVGDIIFRELMAPPNTA
jgi:hypothetical protein